MGHDRDLASLRLYDLPQEVPTNRGMLVLGKDPKMFIDGLWVQYVHFDGLSRTDPVLAHQEYQGTVFAQLAALERLPKLTAHVVLPSGEEVPAYPKEAIFELLVNAVLHRTYGMGAVPIQFYAYANRIEIDNPGGLHYDLRMKDFGHSTAYRNHLLAEALKSFGFVHKYVITAAISKYEAAIRPPVEGAGRRRGLSLEAPESAFTGPAA